MGVVVGDLILLAPFLWAVAMFPISIVRIATQLKRRENVRGALGVLAGAIAILGFYALGLYPVFMSARAKARDIACTENMRALGRAMIEYAEDHDERFPPAQRWGDAIRPYLKPTDDTTEKVDDIWHCPATSSTFSYAFNVNLPNNSTDVNAPGNTVMLFEADAENRNTVGDKKLLTGERRHYGRLNYTFADGHTQSINPLSTETRVDWDNAPQRSP